VKEIESCNTMNYSVHSVLAADGVKNSAGSDSGFALLLHALSYCQVDNRDTLDPSDRTHSSYYYRDSWLEVKLESGSVWAYSPDVDNDCYSVQWNTLCTVLHPCYY
jgi:hypothetical protein